MSRAAELLIELERGSGTPLRVQLENGLREAIRTGRLAPGDRVPSSRALATDLGLSRGVVQECFAQLVAEGYLTSETGSGTRVAETATEEVSPRPPAPPAPSGPGRMVADFASGVPDLASFPRTLWAWAIQEVCRTVPHDVFDYGDPRGEPRLRETLAAYLRRVRATAGDADDVVVCSGMQQGLALVLSAVRPDAVACEDPGAIETVRTAARPVGSDVRPVPVDEQGIDVPALAASGASVVVVTPAHQWPTGVVLAPGRRHELVAWARECDGLILEDDYDAEYRYDRDPVGTLQGLAPDRVVALGTVSKSLAPALRLGWMVLPERLVADVAAAKRMADRGSPVLDQHALALLIESGRYDRHLRRMRKEYSRRRDALVEALGTHAPHLRVSGLAAGFHAVVHLPEHTDVAALVEEARARGVGLHPVSRYAWSQSSSSDLVLGFGNTPERDIRAGIAAIADLLATERGNPD